MSLSLFSIVLPLFHSCHLAGFHLVQNIKNSNPGAPAPEPPAAFPLSRGPCLSQSAQQELCSVEVVMANYFGQTICALTGCI